MKQSAADFRQSLSATFASIARGPSVQELNDAPFLDRWQMYTNGMFVVAIGFQTSRPGEDPSILRTAGVIAIDKDWRWILAHDGLYKLSSCMASQQDGSLYALNKLRLPILEPVDTKLARTLTDLFREDCHYALSTSGA